MYAQNFRTFSLIALTLAVAPGCSWPTGEVCDQRNQLLFAGKLANSAGKMCEIHDYDDDRWPAAYDMDDRLDKGDNGGNISPQDGEPGDIDGEAPDGRGIGPIEECILDTPSNDWRDGHPPYWDETVDMDWDCVRSYWAARLDELCTAWEDGTFPFEQHVIDSIDDNHYEREEDAYLEYCR
jgi:hypothetical protein